MKNLKLAFLGGLVLTASVNLAFAGNEGSGGGDANSTEIRKILTMFKNDGKDIRGELTQIFKNVVKFDPAGKTTELIHGLVDRGILEDFKEAPYVLKPSCVDELGIERSATTLKVDLSGEASPERPEICINIRRLAQEKASRASVVGLLVHEHARHFGEEDTNEFGIHPLAEFITAKYERLTGFLNRADSVGGVVFNSSTSMSNKLSDLMPETSDFGGDGGPFRQFGFRVLSTQQEKNIEFVIDQAEGNCKDLMFRGSGDMRLAASVRSRFSLQDEGGLELYGNGFSNPFRTGDPQCSVTYHLEIEGVSSKRITTNVGYKAAIFNYVRYVKIDWLNDIE